MGVVAILTKSIAENIILHNLQAEIISECSIPRTSGSIDR